MGIDWAATGSMLTGIGTIGSGIAILAAAFLGRKAAANFGEQKQAERQMELAERALAAAYKLESAIDAVRSPFSSAAELKRSEEELSEQEGFDALDEREKKQTIQANVFYLRLRHFDDDFDEASSLVPFIRAYFGEEAGKAMEDIIHARHTIRVYADAYAEDSHEDQAHTKTVRSYIWRGFSQKNEDPIRANVDSAIEQLESVLTPIVRNTVEPAKELISDRND